MKIGESLKRFGVNEKCQDLLIARFNASDEDLARLVDAMKGELADVQQLNELSNKDELMKIYKITPEELTIGTLVDAIMCRIGARDALI